MSLHAQLSPEAEARFQAQKRNSMITSIIIALLAVGLVILVLLYILLPAFKVSSPPIVTYSEGFQDDEQLDQRKVNDQIKRQPSAPSSSMAKVMVPVSWKHHQTIANSPRNVSMLPASVKRKNLTAA